MFSPRAFTVTDLAALDALAEYDSFVTLITWGGEKPTVSHIPVLYYRHGDQVELRGHWAKANPQSGHAGPALAILRGPHAYISASWYPDKEEEARVPTWNYAVAHLQGNLITFDDKTLLTELLNELTDEHETRVGSDWQFDPGQEDQAIQLRGIVGFRLRVDSIAMKFKLNQNHPVANQEAVIARLERLGGEGNRAVADLMRQRVNTTSIDRPSRPLPCQPAPTPTS